MYPNSTFNYYNTETHQTGGKKNRKKGSYKEGKRS